ncbi:MAG: sulfite exporter TauE/SafE family protein [Gammaproteobacteria bacterium]|nr:sulfite exporter TauE/SafE family protein [Gammaproteobacteria bacterium]
MLIEWLLLGLVVLLAGIVRGCTGFGFSALVVAAATLFYAPSMIVPMVIMLEIIASIQMALATWRDADWPLLAFLLPGTIITTPLGVQLLVVLPADDVRLVIAVLIFCLSLLLASGWRFRGRGGPVSYGSVGLFAGLCNGAAAVGGLPVATFLTSTDISMRRLRATMVVFLFAIDIAFLASAAHHGLYNKALLTRIAAMSLPMLVGIYLGSHLFRWLDERHLRKAVIGLLMLLSVLGAAKSLTG